MILEYWIWIDLRCEISTIRMSNDCMWKHNWLLFGLGKNWYNKRMGECGRKKSLNSNRVQTEKPTSVVVIIIIITAEINDNPFVWFYILLFYIIQMLLFTKFVLTYNKIYAQHTFYVYTNACISIAPISNF